MWQRLEFHNREDSPMRKSDAGMAACGEEALCVFDGFEEDTGLTIELCLSHKLNDRYCRTFNFHFLSSRIDTYGK